MSRTHAPVYFYYPNGVDDDTARRSTQEYLPGRAGNFVWTVKTWAYLSEMGFPCRLTSQLPDEGIVITHREFLHNSMVPTPEQLFVCIMADFYRHPFAQLHVVQNACDELVIRPSPNWRAVFMPHWTESALIARDRARGDTLVNVSYYGLPERLAPQLRSEGFIARLRECGFDFRMVSRDRWNDYSDTDVVLAVRSFARVSFHKYPPTKLYNCWAAGVPALLGRESGYRAEKQHEYDYFEVDSVDHVLRTLIRLRDDTALRQAVTRRCAERAREVAPARVAGRWAHWITTTAAPAHAAWREQSTTQRRRFVASRSAAYARYVAQDFVIRGTALLRRRARALLP